MRRTKMSFTISTSALAAVGAMLLSVTGCTPPGTTPGKLDGSREPVRVMKPEEVKITLGNQSPTQAESVPAPSGDPAPGSAVEKPPEASPPAAKSEDVSLPEARPGEQAAPESQPKASPPTTEAPKEEDKSSARKEPAAPVGEQLAFATEAIAPNGGAFNGIVTIKPGESTSQEFVVPVANLQKK
jgi:hypothetical protein